MTDGELREKVEIGMLWLTHTMTPSLEKSVVDCVIGLIKQNTPSKVSVVPPSPDTSKADDSSIPDDISLCANCNAITHTLPGYQCGKCKQYKPDDAGELRNAVLQYITGLDDAEVVATDIDRMYQVQRLRWEAAVQQQVLQERLDELSRVPTGVGGPYYGKRTEELQQQLKKLDSEGGEL